MGLRGQRCHPLPWFDLTEPDHVHTHLTMDHDLTQSRHCHAGQCGTVSDLAISDISRHLWTGRDGVGGIATHTLKCSNFANLYLKNMNKTGMSGWTSEGRGFMPSSNKTYYSGHLCKENAIYSKTIRPELTEI